MGRRRFIQMREPPYDLVEVGDNYVPEPRAINHVVGDSHYEGLRASDGADISTRTKHREYMKRHGLTTVDDYKESWVKAKEQREKYRTGQGGGAITRRDIAETVEKLEKL